MRLKILTDLVDARRRYAAGDVVDVPDDEEARRWIGLGLAEVEPPPAHAPAPEAAAIESPEETTTLPHGRKRPRG